jgi:hypothetical protein
VVAGVARDTGDGWVGSNQVPTFYVDGEMFGLTTCAEVASFAKGMLESLAGGCSQAFVEVIEWTPMK